MVVDSKKYSLLFESVNCNGIMAKASCCTLNNGFICCAVSSTGILHLWRFSESVDVKAHKTIEVEKCGLSALSMYCENGNLFCF